MIPVVWLSVKITGVPLRRSFTVVCSSASRAGEEADGRSEGNRSPEDLCRAIGDAKKRIEGLPGTWEAGKAAAAQKVADLRAANAAVAEIRAAEKALADYPQSADAARAAWTPQIASNAARSGPPLPHATPFPTNKTGEAGEKERDLKRLNFLALVLCLMVVRPRCRTS